MNRYLTDRDRKLLEVVINKITDKQEQVRELKNTTEDPERYIRLDSKDAGLSAAIGIISNIIWHENKDYFKKESKLDLLDYLDRLNDNDRNTFYYLLEQIELDEDKIQIID